MFEKYLEEFDKEKLEASKVRIKEAIGIILFELQENKVHLIMEDWFDTLQPIESDLEQALEEMEGE